MTVLYSKDGCGPCSMAKRFLKLKNIPYIEKDVADPANQAEAYSISGVLMVPIITKGDVVIRGYQPSQLAQLVK